jgi:hypothetical protein
VINGFQKAHFIIYEFTLVLLQSMNELLSKEREIMLKNIVAEEEHILGYNICVEAPEPTSRDNFRSGFGSELALDRGFL